ncbi:hypothetical protein D9M72_483780 [compost metagenome]
MHQAELVRMQRLALIRHRQRRADCRALPALRGAEVDRVAHQRMADRFEMHADLVRAASLQLAHHHRHKAPPQRHRGQRAEMRARRLAAGGMHDRHARAFARIAADGRVDGALVIGAAPHQRDIGALDRARLQPAHQVGLRGQRARHHHQPGGFLVEPVHDARARQRRGGGVAVQQPVEHGAAPVAGSRVHHQPGGLVDHQQGVVFIDHVQRHVLGRESGRFRRGLRLDLDAVAHLHRVARPAHLAVDAHGAAFDPLLQAAA